MYAMYNLFYQPPVSGRRSSQQRRGDRPDRGPGGEPRKIISVSIGQEVKLHKTEDAWKPSTQKDEKEVDPEEKATHVRL